jgi:sodium-dependent dicarboxylate transporter 2/3/5
VVATWFLSQWISNTATTMMMIPNVISIMNQIESQPGAKEDPATALKMSGGFFLGLAYAASIGGVATKIGTPPNLVLMRVYMLLFPEVHTHTCMYIQTYAHKHAHARIHAHTHIHRRHLRSLSA